MFIFLVLHLRRITIAPPCFFSSSSDLPSSGQHIRRHQIRCGCHQVRRCCPRAMDAGVKLHNAEIADISFVVMYLEPVPPIGFVLSLISLLSPNRFAMSYVENYESESLRYLFSRYKSCVRSPIR